LIYFSSRVWTEIDVSFIAGHLGFLVTTMVGVPFFDKVGSRDGRGVLFRLGLLVGQRAGGREIGFELTVTAGFAGFIEGLSVATGALNGFAEGFAVGGSTGEPDGVGEGLEVGGDEGGPDGREDGLALNEL
jgi:hypothetical protein